MAKLVDFFFFLGVLFINCCWFLKEAQKHYSLESFQAPYISERMFSSLSLSLSLLSLLIL